MIRWPMQLNLGLETIIVDHHQAGAELPQAHAVINPNRQDDTSGLGYLCAAGVVMMLVAATNKELRSTGYYTEQRPNPTCCNGSNSWHWRQSAMWCR